MRPPRHSPGQGPHNGEPLNKLVQRNPGRTIDPGAKPRVSFSTDRGSASSDHGLHVTRGGLAAPAPRLDRVSVESAGSRLEAASRAEHRDHRRLRTEQGQPLQRAESDNEGTTRAGRTRFKGAKSRSAAAAQTTPVGSGARKHAGATAKQLITWVRVWPNGDSGLLQTEKSTLTTQLGIQARDFRIMESQATRQACCILCRDKCIIVSMSHIRCVITSRYVLLMPPEDDRSAIFLGKLKDRIRQSHVAVGRSGFQTFFGEPQSMNRHNSAAAAAAAAAVAGAGASVAVTMAPASAAPAASAPAAAAPAMPAPSAPGILPGMGGHPMQLLHTTSMPARSGWSLRNLASSSTGSVTGSTSGGGAPPPLPLPAGLPGSRDAARERRQALQMQMAVQQQAQQRAQQAQQQQAAVGNKEDDEAEGMEMPFELKALEICLDELAVDIEQGTRELERSLKPAIDGLASSVRSENLDLLRRLKTRLVNLKSIAQTVCDALEELLADDDDMFNMSLSAKEQRELDLLQRVSFAISEDSEEGNLSDDSHSSDHSVKVSEVEMLLEAYLMNFDSMFDRLQDLMENVTDTEAVVNIKLDAQQNRLIAVNIVFQGLSVINYFAIGVFGYFTMNLAPPYPINQWWGGSGSVAPGGGPPDEAHFMMILLPSILGAYCLFVVLLVWLWYKGVLRIV